MISSEQLHIAYNALSILAGNKSQPELDLYSGRIERFVDHQYLNLDHELEYSEFVKECIMNNYNNIITMNIPDIIHRNDVNTDTVYSFEYLCHD